LSVRPSEINWSDSKIVLAQLFGATSDRGGNLFCQVRASARAPCGGLRGARLLCATSLALFSRLIAEGTSKKSPWDEICKSNWRVSIQTIRLSGANPPIDPAAPPAMVQRWRVPTTLLRSRVWNFVEYWNCANIADLFEKIQYTMPANQSGRLDEEQVAEILSYILKVKPLPAWEQCANDKCR
jgi:hypothetical protein